MISHLNTDSVEYKKKSVVANYVKNSNNKTVMRTKHTTKPNRVNVLYLENVIMLVEGSTELSFREGEKEIRAVKIIHYFVLPLAL